MRSWVGANSGMLTQKDIKFYDQKEDQTTVFRVHSIPGGMLYTNFDVSYGLEGPGGAWGNLGFDLGDLGNLGDICQARNLWLLFPLALVLLLSSSHEKVIK